MASRRPIAKEIFTMLPSTTKRVIENTPDSMNESIRQQTHDRVARYTAAEPEVLEQRLRDLDQEWDIERYVETMAPSLTLVGLLLAATSSKKWLILPALVQGFFLQH